MRHVGLDELVHSPRRAVAPSYRVDLVPVLRHFLRARWLEVCRDVILTGVLLATIIVNPGFGLVWWLVPLAVIAVWRLLGSARLDGFR